MAWNESAGADCPLQDVISPLERITRTPSELLEAGAMGAGVGVGMHRAASHVYQHAPAAARNLQQGAKEMRSNLRVRLIQHIL